MMGDLASYESVAHDVFAYGCVSLALAMATETKMVECLCTAKDPLTSVQIAGQLNLKERYAREVLNSLTAIGLIHLEAGTGGRDGQEARYWVPPTCRETLRSCGAFALSIAACGRQYDGVRKCFDLHGPFGVRYSAEGFDAMDEIAKVQVDSITEAILKTPGLRERLEQGIKALEVGCGTGWLFLRFAAMFPNSHFTLTDPIAQPLEQARKQAKEKGLKNVSIEVLDIFKAPEDMGNSFDWIAAMEVIHDLPYPLKALQQITKMLKPGGHYSLIDQFLSGCLKDNLNDKDSAALYAAGTFLCIPESYQEPDSEALGPCWGTEKAYELVGKAGMTILGLAKSDCLGTLAVCMCQKQE